MLLSLPMINRQREDLGDYVRRVMNQKKLTVRDVEERSGGNITDGYVSKIINKAVRNITLDKIIALGKGLGESPKLLFDVYYAEAPENTDQYKQSYLATFFLKYQQLKESEKEFIDLQLEILEAWMDRRLKSRAAKRG